MATRSAKADASGRQDGWVFLPGVEGTAWLPGEPITLRHPDPEVVWRRTFDPPLAPAWQALELGFGPAGIADARMILGLDDGAVLPQHLAKSGRNTFRALFRPIRPLRYLDIALSGSAPLDAPARLDLSAVSPWTQRRAVLGRALGVLKGDPRSFPWRAARFLVQLQRQGRSVVVPTTLTRSPDEAYAAWRERFDERAEDLDLHRARVERLHRRPAFTIIADPESSAEEAEALGRSLAAQTYGRWDWFSPHAIEAADRLHPMPGLERAERINAALADAHGDFVFLPRPGTRFRPHALGVFAALVDRFPDAVLFYADDDDRLGERRAAPRFKPAWSPARALTFDYVGDPWCVAIGRLRAVGGAIEAGRAAQRHDLLLRATQGLPPQAIVHVAQVLTHATPWPRAAATPEDRALVRRRVDGPDRGAAEPAAEVLADPRSPYPHVVHAVAEPPLVSLIMPTRDRADLLRLSVGSIRAKTSYPNYEILVVDNGSREADTLRLFERWAGDDTIRILRDDGPFNYAALNNRAVASARGSVVCLVNNDVEVLDGTWLDEMVGWALQPGIGCVGAKLTYPDGRLQHGGVVTGIAGAAGHRRKRASPREPGGLDELVTVNEVSAVTAACLVVRKAIYEAVGGLDALAFPIGYNDVDFCLKVIRAGYRNLWTPFAELNHHESVSRGRDLSPKTAERFNQENLALRLRWGDRLLADPYYSANLTLEAETGAIRTQ